MSIELVMPSSHLILGRPLLLLPPIPPSVRVFSNESALPIWQPAITDHASGFSLVVRNEWLDICSPLWKMGFGNVFSSWCLGAAKMPSKTLTRPDTGYPRACLSGSLEHGQTVLVPWRGLLPTLTPFLSDLLPRIKPHFCRGHRRQIWAAYQPLSFSCCSVFFP